MAQTIDNGAGGYFTVPRRKKYATLMLEMVCMKELEKSEIQLRVPFLFFYGEGWNGRQTWWPSNVLASE